MKKKKEGEKKVTTYPIRTAWLNHIQSWFPISIHAANDSSNPKRPNRRIECIRLHIATHIICNTRYWYGGFVVAPPLCCFVSGAVYESPAIWYKARESLGKQINISSFFASPFILLYLLLSPLFLLLRYPQKGEKLKDGLQNCKE